MILLKFQIKVIFTPPPHTLLSTTLTYDRRSQRRACKARGDEYNEKTWSKEEDAELLERCDFGIFIECSPAEPAPPRRAPT